MYLAPVSGSLSLLSLGEREREERWSRAGLERPFGQPGRASEHARTAAPFTGATAQKKKKITEVVASGTSGASLAAGARAGAEVFEKPSGDGDDDDDDDVGDDAGSGVSVRSRVSLDPLVDPPQLALTGSRPALRAKARKGCGTGRGPCRLPPVRARARSTGRGPGRARASLSLAANTAGPSCYTAPGRLDDRPLSLLVVLDSSRTGRARERSRVRRDAAKRGARRGRRGAGSRARAPRDVARYASLSPSLSYERE